MLIRPALVEDAAAIARVHVQAWRETYRGIMPDTTLDALDIDERARSWRERIPTFAERKQTLLVVDDAGAAIGIAGCGPTRLPELPTDGEIYLINILSVGKRRGIGVSLMHGMADSLIAGGFASIGLWVLEANTPARAFYERLGGRPEARTESEFDGVMLPELGYVWPEVQALKRNAEALSRR